MSFKLSLKLKMGKEDNSACFFTLHQYELKNLKGKLANLLLQFTRSCVERDPCTLNLCYLPLNTQAELEHRRSEGLFQTSSRDFSYAQSIEEAISAKNSVR